MPSRTVRNAASRSASVPRASAGSGTFQRSCSFAVGGIGQFASHTVTQTSNGPASASIDLLHWPEMSIPFSRITRTASGCSSLATVPALSTMKRSPPFARRKPSAI